MHPHIEIPPLDWAALRETQRIARNFGGSARKLSEARTPGERRYWRRMVRARANDLYAHLSIRRTA